MKAQRKRQQEILKDPDDDRGYIRVSTDCPVRYRVINPEEPKKIREKRHLLDHMPPMPCLDGVEKIYQHRNDSDAQILEMLLWLDWKVNLLLKTLTQERDQEIYPYQGLISNLSATGIRLLGTSGLEPDSWLELQLILPVIPFREMYLPGEVVWRSDADPETSSGHVYEAGVEFRDIKESDREQVIRYVLGRQMELRREEK